MSQEEFSEDSFPVKLRKAMSLISFENNLSKHVPNAPAEQHKSLYIDWNLDHKCLRHDRTQLER